MQKLSIIIPFNNGSKYLDRCLKNISKIDFINYEIILIDDYSEDNSEEIAKKYKNIKYYYTKEETIGVGNARNLGVEKAQGKYIMFLDVDDTPNVSLLQDLEKYMNMNIDMIKYKMKIINNDRKMFVKGPTFSITDGEDAFNKLCFRDNYLDSPCVYLIKKELFERTNLKFEKNVYHEDFGLIPLLIIKAKSVVSTDVYMYNYYQSENSIMRNKDYSKKIKKVNDKLFLYDKLKQKINNMKLKNNTKNNLLEYYTNSILMSVKELKYKDRVYFENIIREKGLIKNIRAKNIIKKMILKFNIELYFRIKV